MKKNIIILFLVYIANNSILVCNDRLNRNYFLINKYNYLTKNNEKNKIAPKIDFCKTSDTIYKYYYFSKKVKEIQETPKDSNDFIYRRTLISKDSLDVVVELFKKNKIIISSYHNKKLIKYEEIENGIKLVQYFHSKTGNKIIQQKFKNKEIIEEIAFNFKTNTSDTISYYLLIGTNKSITYTKYDYILTFYKYKRLSFTFDYYKGDSITRIRKSNIDFKKLKRYNYSIEEVFNDLNKFFPMTKFVIYDDYSKEKRKSIIPRN